MRCCTGINSSHTADCPENTAAELVCYCCLETFSASQACIWNDRGSRCMPCEGCPRPCVTSGPYRQADLADGLHMIGGEA